MRRLKALKAAYPLPLRVRLTLAFAVASAILLGAVGTFVFLQVKSGLDASLDSSLRSRSAEYADLAGSSSRGRIRQALRVEGEPAQLLSSDGRVLAQSPTGQGASLLSRRQLVQAQTQSVSFERNESTRYFARPAGPGRTIVVSTSMGQRERALESLGSVLLIGGPLILLLSSGAGYLVASGALRPVERMRRRAAAISAATSDARLPVPNTHDEIRRLGDTLNAMLTRLQAAAAHERAFLDTASHELRTPLAILKAEVDLALDHGTADADLRPALRSIGGEADRLVRLAEDLLVVARDDAGALPIHASALDLRRVAGRIVERFALTGRGEVRSDIREELTVDADESRLEQALGNLVDNAFRHGGAPVTISAVRRGGNLEVHVKDRGSGFARNDLSRVFERSTGGRAGGFGLGLAIVATIARAHGGDVGVTSSARGADVWLSLPSEPPSASPVTARPESTP